MIVDQKEKIDQARRRIDQIGCIVRLLSSGGGLSADETDALRGVGEMLDETASAIDQAIN